MLPESGPVFPQPVHLHSVLSMMPMSVSSFHVRDLLPGDLSSVAIWKAESIDFSSTPDQFHTLIIYHGHFPVFSSVWNHVKYRRCSRLHMSHPSGRYNSYTFEPARYSPAYCLYTSGSCRTCRTHHVHILHQNILAVAF